MKTPYSSFIKYLRENKGLSQANVAEKISISRTSYIAMEKGERELTLSQAHKIANLFNTTIDELVQTKAPNHFRYREMILCFLRSAKTSKTAIKKTKLAQLLYLADFSWYYKTNESLSGFSYRKTNFGPVSDMYFSLLEELEQNGSVSIRQIYRDDYHMYEIEETKTSCKKPLRELNKKMELHLNKIWLSWEKASTAEITKFVTEQIPYQKTNLGENINYALILEEESYNIF